MVSSSAPGTSLGSSGSPGKFLFYIGRIVTTVLPSLVPPRHIDDCGVTHILHEELCDPKLSSRPKFSALGTTVPARLLQEALVIFVFKQTSLFGSFEVRVDNAYPNQVPLLLATPLVIHEKNWQCLDI